MFHRNAFISLMIAGAAIMNLSPAASPALASEDVPALVQGNTAFGLELYARLKETQGNLFFSPHSISTALAMTYAGARGQTEAEMARVLHFSLSQDRLHRAFAKLEELCGSDASRGYRLSVANALWVQQGDRLLDEFLELTRANYGAGLREVDFRRATEQARRTINLWVEEQTQGKIRDLLKPDDVDPLTALVLTNAIYFKGHWRWKFDARETRDGPFTVSPGRQVPVPMMRQKGEFRLGRGNGVQLLELPYAGDDLSMIVLLPTELDGLAELEKMLTADNLSRWLATLRDREITVVLPRFEMTVRFDLSQVLRSMGMSTAFSGAADFSGITGNRDLFISKVLHKAFVGVDEEGTEAAAATGVVMKRTSVPPVFRADHPFVFLIRHNPTGAVVFVGRLVNPGT